MLIAGITVTFRVINLLDCVTNESVTVRRASDDAHRPTRTPLYLDT